MAKRCQPSVPSRRPRISIFEEQISLSTFYKLGDTVGVGGFGKVKLAVHTLTGETVAIKIMDKKALGDEFARAEQEIKLLQDMRHPRICELYEVIDTPDKLYLVMEHCKNGELFDFLMEKARLIEADARIFFRQIVSAVAFLHKNGCAHRDLKPENILLDEKQNVRLIDFGLAARPKGGMTSLLETCCGSPAYVAPELIDGDPYLGGQADIWSLGVMLFALVTGSLPFNDDDVNKLFLKIKKGHFEVPQFVTMSLKGLLHKMLALDPASRITMDELLTHRWVIGNYGVGVKWDFPQDTSVDPIILKIMSAAAPSRQAEMRHSVENRSYNYWHSTYLILKTRQRLGKSVKLDVAGLAVINPKDFRVPHSPFRMSPSKNLPEDSIPEFNASFDRYDDSDSDTSMSETGSANSSQKSVFKTPNPLPVLNRVFRTPPSKKPSPPAARQEPSPRLTPSKSWEVDLDRDSGWSDSDHESRDYREMCRSVEGDLASQGVVMPENEGMVTPTRKAKRATPRLTVRKMFGSIEKGLGRVKEALTPRTGSPGGRQLRRLKGRAITNKVTGVNSTDSQAVLEGIKNALSELGYVWKAKKPFVVRAKKIGDKGTVVMKLSLEVVWIEHGDGTCGIVRKRMQGEGFEYKKQYVALLTKVLDFANAATPKGVRRAKLMPTPTRLTFDI